MHKLRNNESYNNFRNETDTSKTIRLDTSINYNCSFEMSIVLSILYAYHFYHHALYVIFPYL